MKRTSLSVIVAAAALACACGGCSTTPAVSRDSRTAPSRLREPLVNWEYVNASYSLGNDPVCAITDTLTFVANLGQTVARVASANVDYAGNFPGTERTAIFLAAERTDQRLHGELVNSTHPPHMAKYSLRSVAGATLLPATNTGPVYAVVLEIRVSGRHPRPWGITGITLDYKVGGARIRQIFKQKVALAPSNCPR